MKKMLLLVLLVSGCAAAPDPAPAIAVAECFIFATIDNSGQRRVTPPARPQPAGGGVVLSAPCCPPRGRHLKTEKNRKGLFRAKRNRGD